MGGEPCRGRRVQPRRAADAAWRTDRIRDGAAQVHQRLPRVAARPPLSPPTQINSRLSVFYGGDRASSSFSAFLTVIRNRLNDNPSAATSSPLLAGNSGASSPLLT